MFKKFIQKILEKVLDVKIYKEIPRGVNVFEDLLRDFPDMSMHTFFDVGANVGQSVKEMNAYFDGLEIYAFEPISKTYESLVNNCDLDNIHCYNIALGGKDGNLIVDIKDDIASEMVSLVESEVYTNSPTSETIKVETLDDFCGKNGIEYINYLKIDTEGYDLNVLKGAQGLIRKKAIKFIQVEAGISKENSVHVKYSILSHFLESKGFQLYGFYEQTPDWPNNSKALRRVNAVFFNEETNFRL